MARHSPLAKRALTETKTWMWSHLLSRGSSCIFIRSEVEAVDHELFFLFENMCLCVGVFDSEPRTAVFGICKWVWIGSLWWYCTEHGWSQPEFCRKYDAYYDVWWCMYEWSSLMFSAALDWDYWNLGIRRIHRSWRSVGQRLRLSGLRPRDKNQCQGLEIEIRCIFFNEAIRFEDGLMQKETLKSAHKLLACLETSVAATTSWHQRPCWQESAEFNKDTAVDPTLTGPRWISPVNSNGM